MKNIDKYEDDFKNFDDKDYIKYKNEINENDEKIKEINELIKNKEKIRNIEIPYKFKKYDFVEKYEEKLKKQKIYK